MRKQKLLWYGAAARSVASKAISEVFDRGSSART